MQKKFFSLIVSLTLILSSFGSLNVFAAATEQQLAGFLYTPSAETVAGNDFSNGNKDSGYNATTGVFQAEAKLFASVDGENYRKLEWSSADNEYEYGTSKIIVPVMSAGKKNPWGKNPYFEVQCPTTGYKNITFSAKISGTNSGPAHYKLQYSTDGNTYQDAPTEIITASKKDLKKNVFDNVELPEAASDQSKVYFRIIATNTSTISGKDFEEATSGEAAINDIIITGTSMTTETPTLAAPTANIAGGEIYGNTAISLSCSTSETAQIKYIINGGEEIVYSGKFKPFKNITDTKATIRTWAEQDGYNKSNIEVYTYTATKDEITSFDFADEKDIDYVNGAIKATSGVYPTGKITASLDGVNKYSPLYSAEDKAISIAPDDTYTWHNGGYWQIEASTAGYNDVYMSISAFSSKKGPSSMTLKYSTDGVTYTELVKNKQLPSGDMGVYYSDYTLPSDAANKQKVYIRLVTEEDKKADEAGTLFDAQSKGNTYINNIVITGDRTNTLKMPYTKKSTAYFGNNGTISYTSPDDIDIKYSIYTKKGTVVTENALYDASAKISLASLAVFDTQLCNEFRVDVWTEKGAEKSLINSQLYTFKGDVIAAFEYDSDTTGGTDIEATVGKATLNMYPNGKDKVAINYKKSTNALRAAAGTDNPWNFDTLRTNPDSDGYWLIILSTKGYENIKLSADQLSTEKGPRDYSISYSTNGTTYIPLANSSVRMTESLNAAYSNISLPDEVSDKENVFIKIKIDGGETVSGVEFTSDADDPNTVLDENVYGKGNTDINNIEICGTKIEDKLGIDGNPEKIEKGEQYYVNYESSKANPTIIIAGYYNNELVFCDTTEKTFSIPKNSPVTKIKIMMWENLENAIPLTSDLEKTVQ